MSQSTCHRFLVALDFNRKTVIMINTHHIDTDYYRIEEIRQGLLTFLQYALPDYIDGDTWGFATPKIPFTASATTLTNTCAVYTNLLF